MPTNVNHAVGRKPTSLCAEMCWRDGKRMLTKRKSCRFGAGRPVPSYFTDCCGFLPLIRRKWHRALAQDKLEQVLPTRLVNKRLYEIYACGPGEIAIPFVGYLCMVRGEHRIHILALLPFGV